MRKAAEVRQTSWSRWANAEPHPGDLLSFQACVQNFSESPLWALEKIKNVFNETKNLLKMNQSIFSKNCSDSFAKCSVPGKQQRDHQG